MRVVHRCSGGREKAILCGDLRIMQGDYLSRLGSLRNFRENVDIRYLFYVDNNGVFADILA